MNLKREQRDFLAGLLRDAAAGRQPELSALLAKAGFGPLTAPAEDVIPLTQAASILGVTLRQLQLCAAGRRGPGLPVTRRGRTPWVSLAAARAYLSAHTRCALRGALPASPRVPASGPPGAPPSLEDDVLGMLAGTVRELRGRILSKPDAFGSEEVRALTGAIATLERLSQARNRERLRFDAELVAAMLRSLGVAWIATVQEEGAPRRARRLVAWIRETLGVDLPALNVAAVQLLESLEQEELLADLKAVQAAVDRACDGTRGLPWDPIAVSPSPPSAVLCALAPLRDPAVSPFPAVPSSVASVSSMASVAKPEAPRA